MTRRIQNKNQEDAENLFLRFIVPIFDIKEKDEEKTRQNSEDIFLVKDIEDIKGDKVIIDIV